jgi:hypothetical protein
MKEYWGSGGTDNSTHFLTSALDGGEWSVFFPGHYTPWERAPDTYWIGGSVDPRAILDVVVKRKIPSPYQESNPSTLIVQPGGQCYTNCAIMAPFKANGMWCSQATTHPGTNHTQCCLHMKKPVPE